MFPYLKDVINKFGINFEYRTLYTSNFRNTRALYEWKWITKHCYWWTIIDFQKLTWWSWLKLCLSGGYRAISSRSMWKSHPLHLVWQALKCFMIVVANLKIKILSYNENIWSWFDDIYVILCYYYHWTVNVSYCAFCLSSTWPSYLDIEKKCYKMFFYELAYWFHF
jgi:hypothetical protein